MEPVILELNRAQSYIDLSLVTKISTSERTLRMWAGSNVEVFSAPFVEHEVAVAVAKRLARLKIRGTDGVLPNPVPWQQLVTEAEEYVRDNKRTV